MCENGRARQDGRQRHTTAPTLLQGAERMQDSSDSITDKVITHLMKSEVTGLVAGRALSQR